MKRIWKGFGEWVAVEMDSRTINSCAILTKAEKPQDVVLSNVSHCSAPYGWFCPTRIGQRAS